MSAPFKAADLDQLDRLLWQASAVASMREISAGNHTPTVIGLRHDVDDNVGALDTAVKIARWEAERGYRSTYFLLHTASYWRRDDDLRSAVEEIAIAGHEIGIHANAIAEALRTGTNPDILLTVALEQLRSFGVPVCGVAGHGDSLCGQAKFVNDEQFVECARPKMGATDRTLTHNGVTLKLAPKPLAFFGLTYESLRLPKGHYQSDSGGRWYEPLEQTMAEFPYPSGQLHVLWHPDWWAGAFS